MRSKRCLLLLVMAAALVLSCAGSKNVAGGGLWSTLGGVTGVSALSSSFAKNLAANAATSQALGSAGIQDAKMGLYNSIAKAGGYGPEKGTDLLSVLRSKKLDAAAVDGVAASLTKAGQDVGLKPDQSAALKTLWDPMAMTLEK